MDARKLYIRCDTSEVDSAIEKMNRLKELLSEVNSIIGSLDEITLKITPKSEL